MNKQTVIPAGYRLTVHSWENDSDHHEDKVLEGLLQHTLLYYVDLCRACRSTYFGGKFGNLYEPSKGELAQLREDVLEIARRHPLVWGDEDPAKMADTSLYHHVMSDLDHLGLTGEPDGFLTRHCEKIKVEHVPIDITINDVSDHYPL